MPLRVIQLYYGGGNKFINRFLLSNALITYRRSSSFKVLELRDDPAILHNPKYVNSYCFFCVNAVVAGGRSTGRFLCMIGAGSFVCRTSVDQQVLINKC